MNKKKIIITGILLVVVIAVVAYILKPTVSTIDSTILKNQTVDGLSFEEANMTFNDGITTFTVNVSNDNKETYSLKYVEIKFTDPSDDVVTLIGYVGESLLSDETRAITASIDKDITSAKKLEYSIVK